MAKYENLAARRLHCPNCDMRMMLTRPGANEFQCFRCGYVGPCSVKQQAAE
jgi:predicted RNA-binding Zn-ribbon protein involved in translation (DUF1610 family)